MWDFFSQIKPSSMSSGILALASSSQFPNTFFYLYEFKYFLVFKPLIFCCFHLYYFEISVLRIFFSLHFIPIYFKFFLGDILIIQHTTTHESYMLQNKKYLRMEQSSMHAYHQVFYYVLKLRIKLKNLKHYKS